MHIQAGVHVLAHSKSIVCSLAYDFQLCVQSEMHTSQKNARVQVPRGVSGKAGVGALGLVGLAIGLVPVGLQLAKYLVAHLTLCAAWAEHMCTHDG
jgi:hypothetical protein